MKLYVDRIKSDNVMGIPGTGERVIMEHDAQVIASEDDVLAFIRHKIEGASVVRVIFTNGDEADVFTQQEADVFTQQETVQAFQGLFGY